MEDEILKIESITIETKEEETNINTVLETEKSLFAEILDLETNKNLIKKPLTEKEKSILKELISFCPDSLNDINKCILEIIKDGKIDALDIPSFIYIVKTIYVICHQKITIKVSNLIDSIGSILKYIIQVILNRNNLLTPDLIKSIDGLIDMSVDMIKLNSLLKTKTCYFKLC